MSTKTTRSTRARLAGLLALAVLAGRSMAQSDRKEGEAEHYAWDGTPQDGPTLLKEIAAARVAMEVEGDLAAVETRLQDLWLRATEVHGFEGQSEALVQVALARAELQRRLGKWTEVLEQTRRILLERMDPGGARGVSIRVVPASSRLLIALPSIEGDPRLVTYRFEFEKEQQENARALPDSLRGLVDAAWENRAFARIQEIGSPAFEPFAEHILREASEFPATADVDPLLWLAQIDERRAARWLDKTFDAGGYLWRKRMLRVLAAGDLLENPGTWTSSRPAVCLEPEWLGLVGRLLADPRTATDALPFVASIEHRDALTEELCTALSRALVGFGPDFATAAMTVFDHPGVVGSAQPVLEAALELMDPRLRRFAAEKLVNFERSAALLAHADDLDLAVQRAVVKALRPRQLIRYGPGNVIESPSFRPNLGAEDAALVRRLLASPDEGVRDAAVPCLDSLPTPPPNELLQQLLQDPSPEVRSELVWITSPPAEVRASLLEELARDEASNVVESVDRCLQDAGRSRLLPGPFVGAITVRMLDQRRPIDAGLGQELLQLMLESAEGTRAVVSWVLAVPSPAALSTLAKRSELEHLLALPEELLARLLASTSDDTWEPLWKRVMADALPHAAALRLVLANTQAPRWTRVTAASLVLEENGPTRASLASLLREPSWSSQAPNGDELDRLRRCSARLGPAAGNALALEVLSDGAVQEGVADALVSGYVLEGPGARELTAAILERWLRPGAPGSASVRVALQNLSAWPDLATPALLERALLRPEFSEYVVSLLGNLADPAYLGLLARAMQADWMPSSDRNELRQAAATALGSFDDERAVDLLLGGLRSDETWVRAKCQESLGRIDAYRNNVRAWRAKATPPPTKASAAAELLAMLAEPDAGLRRQAALGLGTLGAVECLPQLLRLLKDADAGVREAAQKAIDRLNAPANPLAPKKE